MQSKEKPKLHPKYGVNPTKSLCIMCGEERGDVQLLGASIEGEAPLAMITDYAPCARCQANLLKYNSVMLVDTLNNGETITGRVMVVKDEGYRDMFSKEPPVKKVALLHHEHFEQIFNWFTGAEDDETKSVESPDESV